MTKAKSLYKATKLDYGNDDEWLVTRRDEVEFRKSQFVCEPVEAERTFADLYA